MEPVLDLVPAFLTALAVIPLLVRLAPGLGLLDVPTARSTHAAPVPRVGGIGLFLGMGVGIAVLAARDHGALDAMAAWWPYLLPALCYFAIGLADDRWRLPPRRKFLAQALAAALAVALGLRWAGDALGSFGALAFGAGTPFLTWLWLVAVVILVNFVDGIDLITSLGAIVLLSAAAGAGAGPGDGLLYGLAAAAVLGLVFWNATPARAFPGDAATHLLGFLMGSAALELPGPAGLPLTRALPWVAASAPLLPGVIDVGLGLLAKARHGIPLSTAHNQHLYQRLTQRGTAHVAVALRYGLLALAALTAVAWFAPRFGLAACCAVSALLLVWHLGGGLSTTRRIPYRF